MTGPISQLSENNKMELINRIRKLCFNNARNALKLANKYLVTYPRDVDMLILKGNVLDTLGRNKKAFDTYLKAHRCDPLNILAIIDIGDYYLNKKGNLAKAIGYYLLGKKHIDENQYHIGMYTYGNMPDIYYEVIKNLANAYIAARLAHKARECIDSALIIHNNNQVMISMLREQLKALESGKIEMGSQRDQWTRPR